MHSPICCCCFENNICARSLLYGGGQVKQECNLFLLSNQLLLLLLVKQQQRQQIRRDMSPDWFWLADTCWFEALGCYSWANIYFFIHDITIHLFCLYDAHLNHSHSWQLSSHPTTQEFSFFLLLSLSCSFRFVSIWVELARLSTLANTLVCV